MKRLVEETEDAFERTLLKSARCDAAPRHGARNAAIALSAAASQLSAPSAAAAPVPSTAGADAALGAKVGTLGTLKWLSIGAVAGALAGAGVMASVQRAPVARSAVAPPPVAAPAATGTAIASVAVTAEEPKVSAVEPPPAVAPATPRPKAAVAAPSTSIAAEAPAPAAASDVRSTLAAEAAAIDRARRALAAGAPDKAIELLDRYESESPTHALAPDAQALRVQAEKARGNSALAKQLAKKFLDSHPNDPHAERVRRVMSTP